MALGTPTAAAVAYSASNGNSVSPAYPTGIAAGDVIVMFVGQKPSTANSGTVTTPTGWTLQDELLAAGGYGTTLGVDLGNTNLRVYTKNTVTGSETGNLAVTLGVNNVSWAFMIRVPVGNGTVSYGTADGQITATPTNPVTLALADGTSATNFQAGDLALWAMCIPTDVSTPSQFSAQSVTATGATFNTAVEFNEPDSSTGNDIGGYSAYASVASGSSSAAPTVAVTATTPLNYVRGPVVLLRVRETAPSSQSLTPSLYANTNSFFSPTVGARSTLSPARYDNTNQFFAPTVGRGAVTLLPARYDNTNTFYTPVVTQTGGAQTLLPSRYDNTNTFFSAAATASRVLAPDLYTNTNAFYSATITRGTITLTPARYDNANTFYSATVTQAGGGQILLPSLYTNANTFYPATAAATYNLQFEDYVDPGYVDPGYIGLALQNVNQFFGAVVGSMRQGNMFSMFFP